MNSLSASAKRLDLLNLYYKEIKGHKLLSRDEEKELAVLYQKKNDIRAANKLIRANLRLVIKIAHEYHNKSGPISLIDLIQQGNVGLVHAMQKYDPAKKTKFSYYASFWIKAYILKYLMDNWSSVKIGKTQAQRKLFFNLKKTRENLKREGVQPTVDIIARRIGVKAVEVAEMEKRMQHNDLSLNEQSRVRTKEEMLDTLSANSDSVEDTVADHQMKALLKRSTTKFKTHLTRREVVIFEKRIFAHNPLTLQKLGERFGISRERVRQIEGNIIRKMRVFLQTEMPDFEYYLAG